MDYHQNARLTIYRREQLARKVVEEKCTLKLAAASFGVSAKTTAKWVRRYRELGPGGSQGSQLAPGSDAAPDVFFIRGKGFAFAPPALDRLPDC